MTTATQEHAIGAEVREIQLDLCIPNPWNKARPVDEPFLQSLRENGQIVIALVRPHPKKEGAFEIIFGERRWDGLKEIGRPTWIAEVREMDNKEAEELCAIENAQRAGLSWQQQSELIAEFLDRHDDEDAPARIASALGITTAQVKRRARMLSRLSPTWLDAIKGGDLPAWTADHFEILAVFDDKFQDGLHKVIKWRAGGMTVAELKEQISEESKTLRAAPWDLEDVTLVPKAGACVGCPARSDAQEDLFGITMSGKAEDASCLNGGCFAKKMAAYTKRKEVALLEKHPDAVKVASDYSARKGALRPHEVTEAKKSDKGAVPAIQYGEGGKVTLGYVKVKKSAKPPTEKDKAKEEAKKREARIDALAIEKLEAVIQDPDTEFHHDAYPLLVQFCLVHGAGIDVEDGPEAEKRTRAYGKKPVKLEELWIAATDQLMHQLRSVKWQLERNTLRAEETDEVKFAAWMVEADFSALRKEAEEELAQPGAAVASRSEASEADPEDDHEEEGIDDAGDENAFGKDEGDL